MDDIFVAAVVVAAVLAAKALEARWEVVAIAFGLLSTALAWHHHRVRQLDRTRVELLDSIDRAREALSGRNRSRATTAVMMLHSRLSPGPFASWSLCSTPNASRGLQMVVLYVGERLSDPARPSETAVIDPLLAPLNTISDAALIRGLRAALGEVRSGPAGSERIHTHPDRGS